jgi:3-hydroxymyristoyl/3-hydroxydecanoyl-(acyl carrier protein) dehydratase
MPRPEAYQVLGSRPEGDGWLLTARIPAASPLLTGHFPGHPILPGVAHLALVTRALSDWRGREVVLAGVRAWKLRRPAGPDETLAVHLSTANDDGDVGFTLEKEGETVSRGTVSWR